jgi:hypothetical protein
VNASVTDVTGCFGNTNGAITTTVGGGVSPYTYAWSNGATTASMSDIGAGNYSVTVTDATSTAVTGSWTVSQPSEISLTAQVSATNCPESNNGAIDLTVTGGIPACTFLWSNGASTEDITGLDAGDYTVTVTDANGCLKTGTWTVVQTNPVCDSISISGTVTTTVCFNAANTITVAGGATPFIVEAPSGHATFIAGQRILFLPGTTVNSGAYLLAYISDSYCTNPTMPMVAQESGKTEPTSMMSFGGMKFYPNPTTGTFTLEINENDLTQGLSAQICDLRGKKILEINLNGLSKQVISLENQPKGMYFIRLFSDEKSETAKILKQ